MQQAVTVAVVVPLNAMYHCVVTYKYYCVLHYVVFMITVDVLMLFYIP